MLNLLKFSGGIYTLRLITADWEHFLDLLLKNQIPLLEACEEEDLTYSIKIHRRDYKAVKHIAEAQGYQLEILSRKGIAFKAERVLHRPALLVGILVVLIFFLFLPTRILFIKVNGNQTVPAQKILEQASRYGVRFGTARGKIRSEHIKNCLLAQIPELSWVGVNTHGCVAEITVKEHGPAGNLPQSRSISGIISLRDSIVTDCTLKSGKMLIQKGQAVKKGQLLISPYQECGKTVRVTKAEGEIYGFTRRSLKVVTPDAWLLRGETESSKTVITLILGKKRIKIYGSSGNQDTVCGRIYKEYCITLPGGYKLPVSIAADRYLRSPLTLFSKEEAEVRKEMQTLSLRFLSDQMIAGKILKSRERFGEEAQLYVLQGDYLCHEMIGRARQEKIGETLNTWNES